MKLLYYDFYTNCVDLFFTNNTHLRVFFNEWTGNIYKRKKIHPILRHFIDHKGLYIGQTAKGTHILIHNHINPGYATVITWKKFAENETVTQDQKHCTNSAMEMVNIALEKVLDGEEYDAIQYSCQTLVNQACTNQRINDDTGRVVRGVLVTVAVVAVLGAMFGGK